MREHVVAAILMLASAASAEAQTLRNAPGSSTLGADRTEIGRAGILMALLTLIEAADYLHITVRTLQNHIWHGEIATVAMGPG